MEAANDADADLAPGISRSASSSGPPARATLLRDQRGVTPTEAGALVLDKAEDLLHLEQAMKDDIGALSGTIAGEVALSAYRRTVHIRQNSDQILSSMHPRARTRARYRTGSVPLRPGKPPFQPNLDRPGASAAERYNRIDAARLEKTSCLRHAVLALDSLFVGDQHVSPTPYYQNAPMLGRLLAEWGEAPAGCLFLLPLWHPNLDARAAADSEVDLVKTIDPRQEMPPVRRLTAILAADLAGYSRLMRADEEGTHERLKAHLRELIEPKIAEHRGRTVKNTGEWLLGGVLQRDRCRALRGGDPARNDRP